MKPKSIDYKNLTLQNAHTVTGWHTDTIKRWLSEGCPHTMTGSRYHLNLKEVIRWREAQMKARASTSSDPEELDPRHEKARLDKAKADEQEAKNALRDGELMEVAQVEDAWTRVVMAIRSGVMALGSRLAPELVGLDTERQIKARIDQEARVVLSDLSNESPS